MSINKLFISSLQIDYSVKEIFDLFYIYKIATISQIYYTTRETKDEIYNDIYITIDNWHNTTVAHNFIKRLRKSHATFIYNNVEDLSCKVYILNHPRPSHGHLLTNYLCNINSFQFSIEKQLLINKILNNKNCADIHHEIKGYLFIDYIQSTSRIQKNNLIIKFHQSLRRFPFNFFTYPQENGDWSLRYGYEVQFQCTQCIICGGFEFIHNPTVFQNVAPTALCSCFGFREIYLRRIANLNRPLLIFGLDDVAEEGEIR